MKIILDAMGSDTHPEPEVSAAVQASKEFGIEIILVGDEAIVGPLLEKENTSGSNVTLVHAPEVFENTDKMSGSALRKAQNSIGVGMDILKSGEADAFISAGYTGGVMAIGLARLGRIKGVKRPALFLTLPTLKGQVTVADIGANAECKPEYLVQFGQMGTVLAEKALNIPNPRVALLSNGEEATKGNELVKETFPLLEKSGLNFIGNVEGKEIVGGDTDIVVTDGFTGNVFLKVTEATAKLVNEKLKESLLSSLRTKIGALIAKPAFVQLRKSLDPGEYGALPLLGLDGLVYVAHGRSDARALVSAIRHAKAAAEADLVNTLQMSFSKTMANK